MRFYTHQYWELATMTKPDLRVTTGTLLRATVLLLGVILVSSCGINFSGKSKNGNGATTPSPTEETVINGRA